MAILDTHVSTFLRTVADPVNRTVFERILEDASLAFQAGSKANAFDPAFLVEPPTDSQIYDAAELVKFHAQRFGLSLSHLKMLLDERCHANDRLMVRDHRGRGGTGRLPKISRGLKSRLKSSRAKEKPTRTTPTKP